MRLIVIIAMLCFTAQLFAGEHPFNNDREGKSFILSKKDIRNIERIGSRVSKAELKAAWEEALKESPVERLQTACAFDVVKDLKVQQSKFPNFRGRSELFLKSLRYHRLIDDVLLRITLRALSVQELVSTNLRDDFEMPSNYEQSPYVPFVNFSTKRQRGKCLHDNFRELVSSYRSQNKDITPKQVIAWARTANREGFITDKALAELQAAGKKKIDAWEITLADYVQKKQFLRTQFPLVRGAEEADFVAKKSGKSKVSHRIRLYDQYSSIQISLMGDVVRKLRMRLDSPKIEISVYANSDEVVEVITLDPMERFRFAIKVLRKEMKLLGTNSYFNGRAPSYTDLMAAGYEMGVVTAKELDEVAGLEEIWNPKKTFIQKVGEWVRMFGGVLSVVVPQPFGFIPSLAMIGMQAIAQETTDDTTDSLF